MSSSPDRASRCTQDSQKLRRKEASPSYQSWLPGRAITGGRSTTLSRIAAVRSTSLSRCSYCSAEATGYTSSPPNTSRSAWAPRAANSESGASAPSAVPERTRAVANVALKPSPVSAT